LNKAMSTHSDEEIVRVSEHGGAEHVLASDESSSGEYSIEVDALPELLGEVPASPAAELSASGSAVAPHEGIFDSLRRSVLLLVPPSPLSVDVPHSPPHEPHPPSPLAHAHSPEHEHTHAHTHTLGKSKKKAAAAAAAAEADGTTSTDHAHESNSNAAVSGGGVSKAARASLRASKVEAAGAAADEGEVAATDAAMGALEAGEGDGAGSADGDVAMKLTQREKMLMLAGLSLALFMAALDNTIVTTALPKILEELGGTSQDLTWIVTSYLLASTALAPSYGRLSDIYGRRNVYIACLVFFLIGSALCGASPSTGMLIISRGVQGLGGGGLIGLAFIVIGDIAAPRDRGKYAGAVGGMFAAASVLGPLLGGVLTDKASWRWTFYINVPIGIVALGMMFYAFKASNTNRQDIPLDIAGTIVMIILTVLMQLAIVWGGVEYPWDDTLEIILMSTAAGLLIAFVFIERDAPAPILPGSLFKIRNVLVSMLASFFLGPPMFAAFVFLPVWFQEVQGFSATDSGLQMLALMLSLILSSMASGIFMTKTGNYRPCLWVGTVLLPIGFFLVSRFEPTSTNALIIPAQILLGAGVGLCMQVLTVMAQNAVSLREMAVATTAVNFLRTTGASIGLSVFSSVFANQLQSSIAAHTVGAANSTMAAPAPAPAPASAMAMAGSLLDAPQAEGGFTLLEQLTSDAMATAFLYMMPFACIPFFIILPAKHIPLKTAEGGGGAAAH